MPRRLKAANVGVAHGAWGEDVAAEHLRIEGLVIVERNVRPCVGDRRIEIDIIAYDRRQDVIVFVEVKQHKVRSPYQRRLRSVSKHKMDLLRRGCRTWLMKNRWHGACRFDVIEVYGEPESAPQAEVDHIQHVRLFTDKEHFVNWEE